MKLPDDKQERMKVLALIGIGVLIALYGAYAGILSPIARQKKEARDGIADLQSRLEQADMRVRGASEIRKNNAGVVQEILEQADRYVLRPRLGNYLIGAKEVIERHARNAGLDAVSVDEIGIIVLPIPAENTREHAFKIYAARVVTETGLNELVRTIEGLEKENPWLCVTSVEILGQPKTPETHKVSFEIQWPVWASTETESDLRKQLQEARDAGESESSEENDA